MSLKFNDSILKESIERQSVSFHSPYRSILGQPKILPSKIAIHFSGTNCGEGHCSTLMAKYGPLFHQETDMNVI